MGRQGEIYNVLGLILPAKVVKENRLYEVSGRTVSTDEDEPADFNFGGLIGNRGIENPILSIRILGFNHSYYKGRYFKGEALVGYAIANEGYLDNATELPPPEEIERLKPRLAEDINRRLGRSTAPDELKLYLVFDVLPG